MFPAVSQSGDSKKKNLEECNRDTTTCFKYVSTETLECCDSDIKAEATVLFLTQQCSLILMRCIDPWTSGSLNVEVVIQSRAVSIHLSSRSLEQ